MQVFSDDLVFVRTDRGTDIVSKHKFLFLFLTLGQAAAAMIISKDLFLLGDQDYLRLPNKDEKRPQGPNMGRSNTAPNHR